VSRTLHLSPLHHFFQYTHIIPSHGEGIKEPERDPFCTITDIMACFNGRKMRMNFAWLRKPWSVVRAALHLLAVGVVLALPLAGQAQTTVNVVSIAGGSSALLGEFTTTPPNLYRQGPVPQAIEDSPFAITGYRPAGAPDSGVLVVTNVIIRDPATKKPPATPLETVGAAMVRWYRQDANTINVIILLRQDSGNGVRYIANHARITDFPSTGPVQSVWLQRQPAPPAPPPYSFVAPSGDGLLVMQALLSKLALNRGYHGSQLRIDTGYSDVTADTIVRYANFPNLNVAGLQGILTPPSYGPVQTLLLLHHDDVYAGNPFQVVFPRADVQTLLNAAGLGTTWDQIDPALKSMAVAPGRRENQSGTRNTEYVDIQRDVINGGFVVDDTPQINPGTGPMLNFVDGIPLAFGYAFVGGVNGNNRPHTRVGGYQDSDGNISYPFPITGGSGDCSLPSNNGQAAYSSDPNVLYQTGVVDGSYPLWSYANFFSRPERHYATGAAAQADIFNALLAPSNPDTVHLEGLLRPDELMVERNYFVSDITGEIVTDGQRVVPLGTAVQVNPPPDDDPQP
jgi:hypothetical protein